MTKAAIVTSTRAYERWLRGQLRGDIVRKDLRKKHEKMADAPFSFLRATYWRWAETALEVCPELATAPTVLAVGDIHLENFGTWRDQQGRLVWGVCDFDEAARMPYALDVARLATSALLSRPDLGATDDTCPAILEGYVDGLTAPRPLVLDAEFGRLRKLVEITDEERAAFWRALATLKRGKPAPKYVAALRASLPDLEGGMAVRARRAGVGSLGRPRFVGFGEWRGAPVVREAKAVVASAWIRAYSRGSAHSRCIEIATGRYRAPDPWYALTRGVVVRRLSPNNHKIEADSHADALADPAVVWAMGHELAAIHLGRGDHLEAIMRDLRGRPDGWLDAAARRMSDFTCEEQADWKSAWLERGRRSHSEV